MKKTELIERIAAVEECTKKAAGEQLDVILDIITDALVDGKEVKLSGFGTFKTAEVAERSGTIQMGDRKGETYVTPAHRKVTFKVASTLKEAVK